MKNEIKYFSMFTGVGGFEIGLSSVRCNTQYECVGNSEIDKYSSQLLAQKFPTIKNYGDATKINPNELPDFDMLCGGFPCQAFSIAGKRKGFQDTRGTMFFEVARILEVKRPKIVFLENVKGLLNHEKGKTFTKILQTLDELGYETQWMVLNSKFFGVPQNRERVFIIGSLRGEPRPEILPFGESYNKDYEQSEKPSPTLTSRYYKCGNADPYISQLNRPTHSNNRIYGEEGISPALNTAQGGNRQPFVRAVLTPNRPEKRQNGRRFKENGEPSFTLTGQDVHGVMMENANCVTADAYLTSGKRKRVNGKAVLTSMHERRIRRLTPIECERLQGFPDGWTEGFSDTQRYKMMGNAVTVNAIKAIGEKLTIGGSQ